ncbi:angiopoietin-related protein 5-like isoform X2 [Polyodon spathula]|uniref:angiopoietin-related protein 5-like isoform X2 n=1 Tax=Polyodon spathula TaxID=7913 RepID=UPI001B7DE317|nr:angiopoietin-related protein 5-like isoform X2 [Polyodon spathula]
MQGLCASITASTQVRTERGGRGNAGALCLYHCQHPETTSTRHRLHSDQRTEPAGRQRSLPDPASQSQPPLPGEHWLGLEKMFSLTGSQGDRFLLRVELQDFEGGSAFADYSTFRLGSKESSYRLHIGAYSGTAGDAFRGTYPGIDQNGSAFSTRDRDSDGCNPCIFGDIATNSCSESQGGSGWWFSRCGSANLNGDWHPKGDNIGWSSGVYWESWKGPAPYSFRASVMKVKAL